MRGKRLGIKILVYFTFVVGLSGVIFCVGYRARKPVDSRSYSKRQQGPAQEPITAFQQPNPNPSLERREDYESYAAKWFEPISILTALLVVGVGITAYIYRGQLQKMTEAVEMAKGQLVAMQHQEQAQYAALEETRKLVSQNERAIKAAEDNVKTVEKTAIYSQRAYLSARVDGKQGYLLDLISENSGNTPANKVEVWYSIGFLDQPPDGLDADFDNHVPIGLIAPRTEYLIGVTYTKEITPAIYREGFSSGRKFYCWGTIWYEDIFHQGRRTFFAFHQQYESGRGVACKAGNEAY